MKQPDKCEVEGCLCQSTTQPITEAVYGKKPRHRGKVEYEAHTGGVPIYRTISAATLDRLAERYGKVRRLAARRQKEEADSEDSGSRD